MAFSYAKLACLLIIAMAVAAPAAEAAFSCGAVTKNLVPCLGYLKGGAGPSPPCCGGVKTLVSMAKTPADRQAACGCLKQTSGAIKGINMGNAASLPSKCGASVPYPISPNVDCSKYAHLIVTPGFTKLWIIKSWRSKYRQGRSQGLKPPL